jgi:hypothetical protein
MSDDSRDQVLAPLVQFPKKAYGSSSLPTATGQITTTTLHGRQARYFVELANGPISLTSRHGLNFYLPDSQ